MAQSQELFGGKRKRAEVQGGKISCVAQTSGAWRAVRVCHRHRDIRHRNDFRLRESCDVPAARNSELGKRQRLSRGRFNWRMLADDRRRIRSLDRVDDRVLRDVHGAFGQGRRSACLGGHPARHCDRRVDWRVDRSSRGQNRTTVLYCLIGLLFHFARRDFSDRQGVQRTRRRLAGSATRRNQTFSPGS